MSSDYEIINELDAATLEQDVLSLRDTFDILVEECAEVIQAASKAKRFGLIDEWEGVTNRQKLETEIGDLLCLIGILIDNKVIDHDAVEIAKFKKYLKMQTWAPTVAKYFKG